ncbi:MAG: flagellar hook-length control protein FliK [Treponema sp.]|nr:flagellar hook-length control protein FliK [Treponema sp.]
MQAATVNPQIDFASLKTFSPQSNSLSEKESFSTTSVSFEDMIQASKSQKLEEKSEPASKTEVKRQDDSSQKLEENSVKDEKVSQKNADSAEEKLAEKIEESPKLKKEQVSEKIEFRGENKAEINLSKKEESGNQKKEVLENRVTKLSDEKLKEVLANTKKLASSEDEKESISIEDIKNLTENDDAALFASITASENMLKNQETSDSTDLSQISENIFDLNNLEESEGLEGPVKTFAFDKDGKIIVKDFRRESVETSKQESENLSLKDKNGLKVTDVKFDGNKAELTMEVPENVLQNITSSSTQTAASTGSNFQSMLTNQIQQNAGEFVKAGSIVLRDNDVGSIKLILKPENLGNVKVDLQISDKNITGRIVVASQEAFNAFKESADSLRQAFIESGFENASFDLAFAGQDAFANQQGSRDENPATKYNMAKAYGDFTDSGEDKLQFEEAATFAPRSSVNIVA